jgi:dihydrofolate reductase
MVVHGVQSMDRLKDYEGEVFVFGGESIYRQLLPYCSKAYITRFHAAFQADVFCLL